MKKKLMVLIFLVLSILSYGDKGYTSILLGDQDGNIYVDKNIDEKHALASVTKMTNLMVVYDEIEKGNLTLDEMVPISEKARKIKGSRIWIAKGSKISVGDLIKATAIYSANNAAYALAEYVSHGNVDGFVEKMNEKARSVGADVEFHTPTGLPPYMTGEKMDVGTARGIYKLSMEALKYPEYIKIASMKKATIQGTQKIQNRNKLLSKKNGIFGIKTGHHDTSGYNISIVSKRNGIEVITIVFGSPDEKTRDHIAMDTINGFYKSYSYENLLSRKKSIGSIKVEKGDVESIKLYPEEDLRELVSNKWDIKLVTDYPKILIAPLKKGDVIGKYRLYIKGEEVESGDLVIDKDIEKRNLLEQVIDEIFNKKTETI